jgi:hypothetical protein
VGLQSRLSEIGLTENCQNAGSLHTWNTHPTLKKKILQKPSAKQIRELLEMNRIHLTQVTKIMSLEKNVYSHHLGI